MQTSIREAAEQLLAETGVRVSRWQRSGTGGKADTGDTLTIRVPQPKTPWDLAVIAHEVGHILDSASTAPSYQREYQAELYSQQQLDRFGYNNDALRKASRWYVAYSVCQALNRKANPARIPAEIWDYIDGYWHSYPITMIGQKHGQPCSETKQRHEARNECWPTRAELRGEPC